ncbi:MAG: NAD-dependent epimerase/dehydratase family protein [Candidatus Nanohalobium sp.]
MKYLVAGKGFIGSALGEQLDGEVKYLDRSSGDYQEDITEEFEIEEEFDVVYHTIGLPPGFATGKQYEEVHVKGTENLLEAVNADKIVYISALNPELDHPFFETKRKSEELVKNSEMDHTIIRPSTVMGRGNKLLDLMRKTSVTRMFPRISTRMQPIKLEDLTDCLVKVADKRNGEALNIAGPEKITVSEMAEKLYREEGRDCLIVPLPDGVLEEFLKTFGFINRPPMIKENAKLLKADNTTESNHAPQLTQLQKPFS